MGDPSFPGMGDNLDAMWHVKVDLEVLLDFT